MEFNPTISVFKSLFKTKETPFNLSLLEVYERIKNGSKQTVEIIEKIRSSSNKEEINELKKQLPAILFNGTFSHRNDNSLIEHSGLCVFDFDHYTSIIELVKAGVAPGSDIANSFAVFIKETGMTFKKENQDEFAKILKLYGESSDSGSLVEILTTCYKGNVSSHIPELTRLVKQKTEAKKGKAVGPGEIFFEIFAGGISASVGDMELDGKTFEIKSIPGARLETERTEGASKEDLGRKAAEGELEDIKDLVSVLAGYDIDDPGKEELISGALDSYIESRKSSIVRSIRTKYLDKRTLSQADDLLRLVGFIQLKCYQLNKNFDYLLAFDCESTDIKIDLVNSNIPVSQLLEKKKDWRFNYDWSTGSGYSTAMKIMAI